MVVFKPTTVEDFKAISDFFAGEGWSPFSNASNSYFYKREGCMRYWIDREVFTRKRGSLYYYLKYFKLPIVCGELF